MLAVALAGGSRSRADRYLGQRPDARSEPMAVGGDAVGTGGQQAGSRPDRTPVVVGPEGREEGGGDGDADHAEHPARDDRAPQPE
jgi:hypothetical protein